MLLRVRTPFVAAAIVALASLLVLAADVSFAGGDAASEAAVRLATHPGFRAQLEARDAVLGRTFTATIIFRAPDRAIALIPPGEWVAVEGGRLSVMEDGALRTSDVGAWLRRSGALVAPFAARARAIAGTPADEAPSDLAGAAQRLGVALQIDMRRLDGRVAIALLLSHALDPAGKAAPGFTFHASAVTDVDFSAASGFPESVRLMGPTGRVEGEVRTISFESLGDVSDALLAPPATTVTATETEPAPRLKEAFVRDALAAILGPLRMGGARDAGLLERERERVEALLVDTFTALYRAGYDEPRLRLEARRAVELEAATVRAALVAAGEANRARTSKALKERFRDNCRRQLKDAVGELVRIVESSLARTDHETPADEAARRKLLAAAPTAALAAFETAIVAPMESEAGIEIDRLAAQVAATGSAKPNPSAAKPTANAAPAANQGEKRP